MPVATFTAAVREETARLDEIIKTKKWGDMPSGPNEVTDDFCKALAE
jgi:hypothetical protein